MFKRFAGARSIGALLVFLVSGQCAQVQQPSSQSVNTNGIRYMSFDKCDPQADPVSIDGFRELEATQYSGDGELLPTTRIFIKNIDKSRIKFVVRVYEGFRGFSCDHIFEAFSVEKERIEVVPMRPRSFGWLTESSRFEAKALREYERACDAIARENVFFDDMPIHFYDRASQEIVTQTHGGSCKNIARSSAVGFQISSGRASIEVKFVGYRAHIEATK